MLSKLKLLGKRVKREIKVYQLVARDKRTPRLAKVVLGIAIGYALMPFDLIPDFIPVLGYVDDAIILPILFVIALKLIPKEIIEDHRRAVDQAE
jgi:uncharacterized membrane protein YkvA (DUF1232 family)